MKSLKLCAFLSAASLCVGLLLTASGEAEAKVVLEKGCKSKQASAVRDNFSKVRSMANQSIVKIEEMDASDKGKKEKATGYYKTWFGTTSAANVAHVKGVFQAVLDVFDRREDYTVRCNPPECAGEFAHTHTGWDYIAVCDAYFESKQAKYNDTMPGIILHELTHSAGHTDDHAYGQADAKKLATSNVPQAIDNADNYEYFAENLP